MKMVSMLQITLYWILFFNITACNKTSNHNLPVTPLSADTTFTNPLLPSGPDPWVEQKDNTYYYTNTFGNRIAIYATSEMSALKSAPLTTIWIPPATGAYSKDIWAPEIHYLQNKWYIYFAADDGNNATHRVYALENDAANPLSNTWQFKGKIADSTDKWAIDASAFEYKGQLYFIWSGWTGDVDSQQNIYIAKMKDPLTIDSGRVMISTPTFDWEKAGAPPVVNEGPEAIINNYGRLFLTYSASGCWTDNYAIGLLTLKENGDPVNAADWTKSATPVFVSKPENGAYAPGHNGFFKSRNGTEDWIIYHANSSAGQGCGDKRNPRIQKFSWKADGTPYFGEPVKINTPIRKPSGEE